jgi:hypothetical protein
VDPYSFDFLVKDHIRELAGEAAGEQRVANRKKRHLTTWLTAVVHLWTPSAPAVSVACDPTCSGVEDHEHGVSA